MSFVPLTEPAPPRGVAIVVAPGVRRLVANNPGPMTYHGTNTYLIDDAAGMTVLDPGPDNATHVADILAAAGGPVARIVVSHGHSDHVGALPALAAATGAPVLRFPALGDGARIGDWTALHTPGHAADHVCLARDDGVVLTADHVMSFSTSVVIPPEGDMTAYLAGLRRLLARDDTLYLPGHGPPIQDPGGFTRALLEHRLAREVAIMDAIAARPRDAAALVAALYGNLDDRLRGFAKGSVTAHLLKLEDDGRAQRTDGVWRAA